MLSWMEIKSLKEQRAAKQCEMRAIVDTAETEHRNLKPDEVTAFEAVRDEERALTERLQRQIDLYGGTPATGDDIHRGMLSGLPDGNSAFGLAGSVEWRDALGRPVHVLAPEHRMATTGNTLSLGKAVQSMITGNWSNAEAEQRALSTSPSSAGFMIPHGVAASTIDMARAQAVVVRAGAQTVGMLSGLMTIAKVTADPVVEVKTENEAFSGADMQFAPVTLTARTIGCIATISRELATDAPNAAQAIEQAIAQALAVKLDSLALFGAGGTEPTGLASAVGVQAVIGVGALSDYSKLISAWTKILTANGNPNAYVLSPRDAGTLESIVTTAGQYLLAPPSIAAMSRHITSSILVNGGTGTNESTAFMGDFSKMLIGLRQDVLIETSNAAGDAFDKNQIKIKATWRGDIGFAQPQHFARLTGITA